MRISKRLIGIMTSIACLLAVLFIPGPKSLGQLGWYATGVLLAVIALWVTEAFPRFVTTLILMLLFTWYGVFKDLSAAYANFFSSVSIVVLGTFFITAMMKNTQIPLRLMGIFLRLCKKNGKAFLAVVLSVTALLSSVMSDMAAATIMYVFIVSLFHVQRNVPPSKTPRLIRAILLGIPLMALAGGMITPVGAPTNVLTISMLEMYTGIKVTFLQWVYMFLPSVVVIVFMTWLALCIFLKPEDLDDEAYTRIMQNINALGQMDWQERKALFLMLAMIIMWIAGSWIPALNTATVIIIGAVCMMLPGMDLISVDDFRKSASWDLFFMMAGVMILAAAIQTTGLLDWVVANTIGNVMNLPVYVIFLFIGVVIVIMRTLIPAGPAIMVLTIPAMVAMALGAGIEPTIMLLVGNIWGQLAFFLPIDIMYALTYDSGQYTTKDMFRVHTPLVIGLLIVLSALSPVFVSLVR